MFVKLFRIIKYGMQSFLRNGWLSLSTIGIMVLALAVFEGLIFFNFVSKGAVMSVEDKVDVSVYFKSSVEEDEILRIKRTLEGLEEVRTVEYVSKEQALKEFTERHKDDEVISETLKELDVNPLLASLNVKAKTLEQYDAVAEYLQSESLSPSIEKVTYEQNQTVIERLKILIGVFKKGGFGLTAFLAFLAVMVTLTTISLAIFSDREQITIMRLVGAPNSFIRGPYVVEGMVYGSIAAFITFLISIPVIDYVGPFVLRFVPGVSISSYFDSNFFYLFLYLLLFGVGLGVVSSWIAIRRYLRV